MRLPSVSSTALALVLALVGASAQATAITSGGYTATDSQPFQWTELYGDGAATRVLGYNDDSTTSAINLGFDFSIFNQSFNQAYITSNGLLTFGSSTTVRGNADLSQSLPFTTMPMLAVAWDDWTTTYSGSDGVYYKSEGAAGSRTFTVEWHKTMKYDTYSNSNNTPVTFEAVLHEGSNAFEYRYQNMNTGGPSATSTYGDASYGASATVGVRDVDAYLNGRYLQWSNNQAVLSSNSMISFNVSAVPEPESYAMMLAGLGLMGAVARRRKEKRA